MIKLWRCQICGDPYIGESAPDNCPFCGAHKRYIKEARGLSVSFDVELTKRDRANAEKALGLEIFNSGFYFCAAEKTDDEEGRQLFKALGRVEAEHASIWRKILKLPKEAVEKSDNCWASNKDNLRKAHEIETSAINFYRKAGAESDSGRVGQIFKALVEVETDHLHLSEERMKQAAVRR